MNLEGVITGRLSVTRKEAEQRLVALGAKVVSDGSSSIDLLVVGEKPGSKLNEPAIQEIDNSP